MPKVIMNIIEFQDRIKTLASEDTYYWNSYPYNLCYVHEDGRISADCNNLYKAILNGYDVKNRKSGYFQRDLSNTGDVDEWGLMSQCEDVTSDFSKLKLGEPRLLYKRGHIGGYIGEIVNIDGYQYNAVEATPWAGDWDGGIIFSWVDADGTRRTHKGGSTNSRWEYNGLMTPWIDYNIPKPEPEPAKQTFKDVTPKMSSYKAIEWLVKQGGIQGYKDGTYRPKEPLTREQIAVILWRLAGKPE